MAQVIAKFFYFLRNQIFWIFIAFTGCYAEIERRGEATQEDLGILRDAGCPFPGEGDFQDFCFCVWGRYWRVKSLTNKLSDAWIITLGSLSHSTRGGELPFLSFFEWKHKVVSRLTSEQKARVCAITRAFLHNHSGSAKLVQLERVIQQKDIVITDQRQLLDAICPTDYLICDPILLEVRFKVKEAE